MSSLSILKQYWGFSNFRPLQEDIVTSILQSKDTLALLPTGGGKSICFQVPALAKEGICIVISPLIALMKDQVDNLKKKGIKALAITSSMSKREIDIALDNCAYGNFKFLYVSPERLHTELFKERVKKMNVNLIAVDEAHCISQWGYDFRPHYLRIAELREILPSVPVLALTATATPEVTKDIQKQLLFPKENVLQKSFERKNLSYIVLEDEGKLSRLLKIINKTGGSGIVYVRNRKKTEDISRFLNENSIASDYYHAGLTPMARDSKQREWVQKTNSVMVCTNAFGMGIDKPDVRFVVHMDAPDCVESYFQEAGRAGRDEKKAYAVLLFSNTDKEELQHHIEVSFPEITEIKKIYNALGNFFELAVGSGKDETFTFDISTFCINFGLNAITAYSCLKLLEMDGYLEVSDAVFQPSRLKFLVTKNDLNTFVENNPGYASLLKVILRSYSGTFDHYAKIQEAELAKRSESTPPVVKEALIYLNTLKVLSYIPQNSLPQVTYLQDRVEIKHLTISKKTYSIRKAKALTRLAAMLNYCESVHKCRSSMLLSYFGENNSSSCGSCDVCLKNQREILSTEEFTKQADKINSLLSGASLKVDELVQHLQPLHEDKALRVIQFLIDNEKLKYLPDNSITTC